MLCFHIFILLLCLSWEQCLAEVSFNDKPTLVMLSKDDNKISDVIVKKINESIELLCQYQKPFQEIEMTNISWIFTPVHSNLSIDLTHLLQSNESENDNILSINELSLNNTGFYSCEVYGLVTSKYIFVQNNSCQMRGSLQCDDGICIPGRYVCDGFPDCKSGEEESEMTCGTDEPCDGKLSCDDNRCIPESACCNKLVNPLCVQPQCCNMHSFRTYHAHNFENTIDEKRIDDYGFLQTTIYTVTACALIFMIAIILLVSAICKMHMKRASACMHPPPPYLHQTPPPPLTPQTPFDQSETNDATIPPIGFARLTNTIFHSRYRPIPQSVEMMSISADQSQRSPNFVLTADQSQRSPSNLASYISPTLSNQNGEYYFENSECCARDLNLINDFYFSDIERNRVLRRANAVERLLNRLNLGSNDNYGRNNRRSRPLTLQLGRLQVNIPRFSRDGQRPDTPNIAEVDLNNVDFVRLNSDETYTLNGRTIRLLGANFENCPIINMSTDFVGTVLNPPPYSECIGTVPAKVFGPPPAYLSRENLTDSVPSVTNTDNNGNVAGTSSVESNGLDNNGNRAEIELPPRYEEVPVTHTVSEIPVSDENGN